MRSFESPSYRETPHLNPERVERISNELLESPEIVDYLNQKIQDKLDFKERVSKDDGTNDFYPWKRLGMFIVHEQKLPDKIVSTLQRNGVDVYGDEVMELHIPPQDLTIDNVQQSFGRLREYLKANQRERSIPRFIYGVSYLAPLAKRWGFTALDLPEDIQKTSGAANILKSYAEAIDDPKKQKIAKRFATEDIKLCYMSVDDLLAETN